METTEASMKGLERKGHATKGRRFDSSPGLCRGLMGTVGIKRPLTGMELIGL